MKKILNTLIFMALTSSQQIFAYKVHDYNGPAHIYIELQEEQRTVQISYEGYLLDGCYLTNSDRFEPVEVHIIFPGSTKRDELITKKLSHQCYNSPFYFPTFTNRAVLILNGEEAKHILDNIFYFNKNEGYSPKSFEIAFSQGDKWDSNFGDNWEILLEELK